MHACKSRFPIVCKKVKLACMYVCMYICMHVCHVSLLSATNYARVKPGIHACVDTYIHTCLQESKADCVRVGFGKSHDQRL